MARRARLTTWYVRSLGRILAPNSERARAVGRSVRALLEASELPGPSDFEAVQRPVGRAWVRRVAGRNVWLWYRYTDDEVSLVTATTEPPVPLAE